GPNGAGKTTLLRLLSTLDRPSSGQARVLGWDLRREADRIRQRIGLVSHHSMLYPDLSAGENLLFYARLYGLPAPQERVDELLNLVELSGRRHDAVRGFSRGMTQRLAIARALINDPQLLLLDEPYSGLDPRAVGILDSLIQTLRIERNLVMISHDLQHGYELASHLLILSGGHLARFSAKSALDSAAFQQLYRQIVGSE
ncbi:MAG: ABC transporter ATP-binding protein, partial [Actinomycetia bacterium]|nr:ABC transporter ATP-binding protein [Actinomycetes bacterium]